MSTEFISLLLLSPLSTSFLFIPPPLLQNMFLIPPGVISRLNDTIYTQGRPSTISSQFYISTASGYGIMNHKQKCALLILWVSFNPIIIILRIHYPTSQLFKIPYSLWKRLNLGSMIVSQQRSFSNSFLSLQ